jgi:hypothetical protein
MAQYFHEDVVIDTYTQHDNNFDIVTQIRILC